MLAGAFVALGSLVAVRLTTPAATPLDWLTAGFILVAGAGAILHRNAVASLEASRRAEAESFARILSGLSRSVSPDAVVGAIVEELADSTGADHVVVVRRRPDARILDATLVSSRPGVPDTTTILPIAALEDPIDRRTARSAGAPRPIGIPIEVDGLVTAPVGRGGTRPEPRWSGAPSAGDRTSRVTTEPVPLPAAAPLRGAARGASAATAMLVAERIAGRVRDAFGLHDTITAPLALDGQVVGAIVLARRVADPWPAIARRLLDGAAHEASMALSRAYSHQAAEARASTDALTGLPNRRYFDEFCGLLARRRRADDAIGVLMIDIDRFKAINDTHGHTVGDEVLRAVGAAIVGAVREDDVPARYGGEEFVVLLRRPSRDVAIEVAERVREAVGGLDLEPLGVPAVSVSVGVAVASAPDQPIDALVGEADAALYRAKRAGRDRVVAA
jgi:diguanylate cyclase (GGDEF)-like protein